jgi:hypothetical protein
VVTSAAGDVLNLRETTRVDRRRGPILLALVLFAVAAVPAGVWADGRAPTPELNFAVDVAPRPCAYEGGDRFEREFYEQEGWHGPNYERYPGACQRMRFAYGPLAVKPGQNDVFVEPVKIEKPTRDGYITRFKPNLVRADGTVPPVQQVHLHHGTWLSVPDYGSGPFFASGEEKTIAPYPKGYGMPVKASDQWLLLYMVHNATSRPMEVYITYDVDFVPQKKAEDLGLKAAYPVWLDVRPSGYPVFNVQRKYGTRGGTCTWPKNQCADFDPWENKFVGQGKPGNGKGEDWQVPDRGSNLGRIKNFTGGTLIGIGGHVHPGGLHNDIDLVRPGGELVKERKVVRVKRRGKPIRSKRSCRRAKGKWKRVKSKRRARSKRARARARKRGKCVKVKIVQKRVDTTRIYTGRPVYWDYKDHSKDGGPPTSWDLSMRVSGLPRWGVHVKPGDRLRSNATYDTKLQSTYENMGIAVTLLVPDKNGKPDAPGLNPFQAKKDNSLSCSSGGLAKGYLCDEGVVTHGHYKENAYHGKAGGTWRAGSGGRTSQVGIANFLYAPGDLSRSQSTGIPQVKLGTTLRFTNFDGSAIYHTITSCRFPCLGSTGAAFPLADGDTSAKRALDFDSSELGFGAPGIGPAKQTLNWQLPVTRAKGFKAGETVTYFCRIHPFMRGAFKVTK